MTDDVGTSLDARIAGYLDERFPEDPARLVPLSGDASTRRYFRLVRGGKTTVLALYPEPFITAELPFVLVGSLLSGFGLPVPTVLDHDGPRGILLLEDLGTETLQDVMKRGECGAPFYEQALEQLLTLQREAAKAPRRDAACFSLAFDTEKLSFELHHFLRYFVEGFRGCSVTASARATLLGAFEYLCKEIGAWPRALCHRDFHSRNLMPREGVLCWIDFQDARMGPTTYDLASLLNDSYVELAVDFVEEYSEAFRKRVLPGEDREVFRRRFELVSVQRSLKALGTFGYMAQVRGNAVYVQYMPRALASARRNLTRHKELGLLQKVLAEHIEELQ